VDAAAAEADLAVEDWAEAGWAEAGSAAAGWETEAAAEAQDSAAEGSAGAGWAAVAHHTRSSCSPIGRGAAKAAPQEHQPWSWWWKRVTRDSGRPAERDGQPASSR
jgi:hypothetical protein